MPSLSKADLHREVLLALAGQVDEQGPIAEIPFLVKPRGLLPLAVWAFTVTSPPGGRHPLESKIQLMLPGQARNERGSIPTSDPDRFPILLGYKSEEKLFVLWDAYKHSDFAFSKNVQVRAQPLLDAMTFGIGRTSRQLATGTEVIIAARGDCLREAFRERIAT